MQEGIRYAKENNADILIATDPDADRVGIAVKDGEDYRLLTGNQVGVLLFDYICNLRIKHNKMPKNPIAVKTIVTTDMVKKVAEKYGVQIVEVLTGFKFIGEQIGLLEAKGEEERYIFGFEESYGYLSGGYVRDKDAVDGAFLIAEMFAYYKHQNVSLISKLSELYKEYGYFSNYLDSFEFEGSEGFKKMTNLMENFRNSIRVIGNNKVVEMIDYSKGVNGLPKSNVLKLFLDNGSSIVIRPSGTEPKLKIYISICGDNFEYNDTEYKKLISNMKELLK